MMFVVVVVVVSLVVVVVFVVVVVVVVFVIVVIVVVDGYYITLFRMHESSGFRKCSTLLLFQLFPCRLCLCHCLYLCVSISVRIWVADVMSFQKMYGLR